MEALTRIYDHTWKFDGPVEVFQHDIGVFDRPGPLTLEGSRGSGADFLPELKEYIEDGKTIICSPHKLYSPTVNDLGVLLRKQRVGLWTTEETVRKLSGKV